jgi:hypothetical protein
MHAVQLQKVVKTLLSATSIASALGSEQLQTWAFNLPLWLGPERLAILRCTQMWNTAMSNYGLNSIYFWICNFFNDFRTCEFFSKLDTTLPTT